MALDENFSFDEPVLQLDQTPDDFWSDLDASLAGQAGLSDLGFDMPAAPSDSYWMQGDENLTLGAELSGSDWWRQPTVGAPTEDYQPLTTDQQIAQQNQALSVLDKPFRFDAGWPQESQQRRVASARLGPNEPTRTGVAMPEPKITSSGKLRTWDTKTGREIGQVGGGNRGGGGDMAGMIQGYNDAVARARNAAEADRNQALQAVAQWRQLIEQRLAKNPFGAEYKAQTLGVVRDARARQYSAAVEELRQAYAQQGKPLDPRLLTMLRMQMSREENGDLRNLSIDTAGKAYAADTSYVNEVGQTVSALDRILSNTSRQPNPQELAFLMSLSRAN
jgi:hypothetical protein